MPEIDYEKVVWEDTKGNKKHFSIPRDMLMQTLFWNTYLHREDGPAIENVNGNHKWYWRGELLPCETQEEFVRCLRIKAFW